MHHTTYTESELVEALKSYNQEAFIFLYDNYSKSLFSLIYAVINERCIAEDVLQEVFIKIWQQIGLYDSSKGRLYTWMIRIARNKAIDYVRSKERNNKSKTEELTESVCITAGESSKIEDVGLKRVLNELPKETKKLIELAYFQGYTQSDIAKILDMPLGTVKTKIRTSLIELRKLIRVK